MTVSIIQLWLPILLSGLFCWFASAIIHMLIKYHNSDYKKLSNEDQVGEALGQSSPTPGIYHLPHCTDMSEMNNPEVQEKFKNGPIALISVFENGMPPMVKLLSQQFLFFIIGATLIAYVTTLALDPSAEFKSVFHFVAIIGFMTFGFGSVPYSIWFGHPWSVCLKYFLDAVIYASVVAATFAWLWPQAV